MFIINETIDMKQKLKFKLFDSIYTQKQRNENSITTNYLGLKTNFHSTTVTEARKKKLV